MEVAGRHILLRGIKRARQWHVLTRVGIATAVVAVVTAFQLPLEADVPGEPFLLYFIVAVASAAAFGRIPGFVTVAETAVTSVLYFDPMYSLRLIHAADLVAIEIYVVVAALSVETICRLVDSALAEKSDARLARIQYQEAQARLAAIVTSSTDPIISKTLDGIITSWNDAAERMFGYSGSEMIGQSIRRLIPTDRQAEEDMILGCLARGERVENYETVRVAKDGRTIDVSVTVSPMRDAGGRIIGASKIVRDITARKQAEENLRKSEERFRSSLLHSPLPIVLFDDREQIIAVSESWLEATGYSREELHRIEDWTNRAHGDHAGEVLEQVREIIPTEPEAHQSERMIRTKDGRHRLWNFVSSALGTQSDGRRLFVSMAQDVTERKAHEEQIQFLMREASHRAKNILGLVQAIARQTASHEAEDFVARFIKRIEALAANQDLLVRNKWQGVVVEDLVRAQLAHFADLFGPRITVDGPKLRLNATAAQAIGLALHELATNAGKYGALSTDAGRVDIRWGTDRDAFAMSWTEREGPPVTAPARRGFGTIVTEAMAKRSVGGSVDLNYAPSGLTWHLTCPAANALETLEREQILRELTDGTTEKAEVRKTA
jgi:PAS domain S-box-containing protein